MMPKERQFFKLFSDDINIMTSEEISNYMKYTQNRENFIYYFFMVITHVLLRIYDQRLYIIDHGGEAVDLVVCFIMYISCTSSIVCDVKECQKLIRTTGKNRALSHHKLPTQSPTQHSLPSNIHTITLE